MTPTAVALTVGLVLLLALLGVWLPYARASRAIAQARAADELRAADTTDALVPFGEELDGIDFAWPS